MKNKNKILRLLLCTGLAGALVLTGCQKTRQAPDEDKAMDEAHHPNSSRKPALTEAPYFTVNTRTEEQRTDDNRTILFNGSLETPSVTGAGYEALAQALDEEAERQEKDFLEAARQYASDAAAELEAAEASLFLPYSLTIRVENTRTDNRILSLKRLDSACLHDAHGFYGYTGSTYDAQTGKRLSLSDLITDWEAFREKAIESCITQAEAFAGEELFSGYSDIIRGSWDKEPNWYLDAAGITLIYNPSELSSNAVETIYCRLTYEEYSDLIKPEYAGFTGSGTAALPADTDVYLTLSETSDSPERVRLSLRPIDKEGYTKDFYVELGSTEEKADTFERLGSAYLIRRMDGSTLLAFDGDYTSDDYSTLIYELTDGTLQKRKQTPVGCAIAPGSVNTDSFDLAQTFDVLGTYQIPVPYWLDKNGVPVTDMTRFQVPPSSYRPYMTLLRGLPVILRDEEVILPAGTLLRVTAFNLKDTVWFETDNHLKGEIHYTREENEDYGPIYINGIWENEYFDSIPYAG